MRLRIVELLALGLSFAPGAAAQSLQNDDTGAATPAAVLSGTVYDNRARPVEGAEVTLPSITARTVTNERGEFRFADLAPGVYDVVIRRIGFQELTQRVAIPDEGTVQRDFFLRPIATLDTIAVSASAVIPSFEDHRKVGLGKFITRAELEKMDNRKMSEILHEIGARTIVKGPRAYVGGGQRGPKSLINQQRKIKELDGGGSDNSCFALVYVNNQMVFNGEPGRLVPDVNLITPSSVEAIEYYKGPAQTPLKYATLNSECGVLVIHTRRSSFSKAP